MPDSPSPAPDSSGANTGVAGRRVPTGTGWPAAPHPAPPPGPATGTGWPAEPPHRQEAPDV